MGTHPMTPKDRIQEAARKVFRDVFLFDDDEDVANDDPTCIGFQTVIAACVADVLDMCEDGSHRDEIAQRIREMK